MTRAISDYTFNFQGQFISGAAFSYKLAKSIEDLPALEITDAVKTEHLSHVVSCVIQSVAALESDIWSVTHWGPGYHLGSNGVDTRAREFLNPVANEIDKQSTLRRYEIVLHLLKRRKIPKGKSLYQDARLVIKLRNEIMHYKSDLGSDRDRSNLISGLKSKNHSAPPFYQSEHDIYFPHKCLSAECAKWAVQSCIKFSDEFYSLLGIRSWSNNYRSTIKNYLGSQ